ncbi:hypothetical protein VR010_11705 [Actinomycetaceae bacterium L2_0104]
MTADDIAKLDGIDIPEPKAVSTEFGDDEESLDLTYEVGGFQGPYGFTKEDGEWKLRNAEFIGTVETADDTFTESLTDAGATVTLGSAEYPADKSHVVMVGEEEALPITVDLPESDLWAASSWEGELRFGNHKSLSMTYDPGTRFVEMSDNLYERVAQDSMNVTGEVIHDVPHNAVDLTLDVSDVEVGQKSECTEFDIAEYFAENSTQLLCQATITGTAEADSEGMGEGSIWDMRSNESEAADEALILNGPIKAGEKFRGTGNDDDPILKVSIEKEEVSLGVEFRDTALGSWEKIR